MEVGDVIRFGGQDYVVRDAFYKTMNTAPGGQRLCSDKREGIEPNKRFYVVECEGERFWIKQWVTEASYFWGTLEDEYQRIQQASELVLAGDGVKVRSVRAHGYEELHLLTEYLEGYTSLALTTVSKEWRAQVYPMVRQFLAEVKLASSYDLSRNNLMVSPAGDEVVLIDFELAAGKDLL